MKGKVKWFDIAKGYGFISGRDGSDVFVHSSEVSILYHLHRGDEVEYDVERSALGIKAVEVKL